MPLRQNLFNYFCFGHWLWVGSLVFLELHLAFGLGCFEKGRQSQQPYRPGPPILGQIFGRLEKIRLTNGPVRRYSKRFAYELGFKAKRYGVKND